MNKLRIVSLFTAVITGLVFAAAPVSAADSVVVRVNQPKSPTNQREFNLSFVALDIQNRPISATCSMKGPFDGGFSSVGAVVSLPVGGGSGSCVVPENRVTYTGNYEYRVTATAGGDSADATVTVAYSNTIPQAPSDYRKEEVNNCDYKIYFHTNDNTDRVELYRSENTSFNADSGTRVGGINIGSNQNGQMSNSVPDCNKNYYFAIRAYNSAGNGSDIVGDRDTYTIVVTPTGVTRQGAIPVSGNGLGGDSESESAPQILGAEDTQSGVLSGTELGESNEQSQTNQSWLSRILSSPLAWIIAIGLVVLAFVVTRRKNN